MNPHAPIVQIHFLMLPIYSTVVSFLPLRISLSLFLSLILKKILESVLFHLYSNVNL